jgi:hypothetical protein
LPAGPTARTPAHGGAGNGQDGKKARATTLADSILMCAIHY